MASRCPLPAKNKDDYTPPADRDRLRAAGLGTKEDYKFNGVSFIFALAGRLRVAGSDQPAACSRQLTLPALRTSLSQPVHLPIMLHPAPGDRSIVLENDEPILVYSLLQDPSLCLQSDERLNVVPHDPRQRKMRLRRHNVAKVKRALSG